jgi:hypothetical protein
VAGNRSRYALLLVAAVAAACGRVSDPAISGPLPTPPTINLSDGRAVQKLVGTWKNAEETYALLSDGSFKLHYDRMEQVGPSKSSKVRKIGDLSGKWSATDQFLMLAVEHGENSKHKMFLILRDNGKTMELRPMFLKNGPGTVYHLQRS